MERENSIKLLNAQKNKLQNITLDEIHWIDETSNIVSNIFGKDSDQLKQIKGITLRIINDRSFTYQGDDLNPMKNRIRAENYIESFITQVENFSYKKENSFDSNKEYKFSKNSIFSFLSVLFVFISGTFFLGLYFGNTKFDKEKIDLTEQVKSLNSDKSKLSLKIKELEILLKKKNPQQN